jgi:hypothetical protein
MPRTSRREIDMLDTELHATEPGMGDVDDRDDDTDAQLDPIGEDQGGEEDDEMEAIRHTCAACGEENEVLPPKGYTLTRKPEKIAENALRRVEREWEPALWFREAYQRKLSAPRTAPVW